MKKYLAELIGTFTLVLLGCGTAVVAGEQVGVLGIAFAFGFALLAMAYGIGPVSGCHINPAVSLSVWVAGRMKFLDFIGYIIFQCIGAILAAYVLYSILSGKLAAYDVTVSGLGQNGWGEGMFGGFSLNAAILFEFVASFLFIVVILGSTQEGTATAMAGLAIGISLVVIHIFGIQITGVSVNPARSLAPALFVGGKALSQLWLFLLVPSIAGLVAGLLFRWRVLGK